MTRAGWTRAHRFRNGQGMSNGSGIHLRGRMSLTTSWRDLMLDTEKQFVTPTGAFEFVHQQLLKGP